MKRVLVAAELEPFLRDTEVPRDVLVELISASQATPAGDYAGILPLLTRRIGAPEMDRLPGLRVIANYAVGYDNIDVAAARSRRIVVGNTPDVLTVATAELTWALILAAARRLGEGERLVRSGGWNGWHPTQLLGMGLDGKLLGIIGAGRIGREVGRRASAFGMRVAFTGRRDLPEWQRETGALRLALPDLLAQADVVSLHLPLTGATERVIDEAALGRMKAGAILVNTARGGLIDESALTRALRGGRIRAAALDVYDGEPTLPAELAALDNAILLPHLGSATEEARRGMWRLAWTNLLAGIHGRALPNPATEEGVNDG